MTARRIRTGRWTRLELTGLLVVTMYLVSCATDAGPLAAAQRAASEEEAEFFYVLKDVERNPGHRIMADAYCQVRYGKLDAEFGLSPLIVGLLEVPESNAAEVYCRALVEAVAAGELTGSDLTDAQATTPEGLVAMGEVMRGLLVAHERLYAQQVQKPPQAQFCGCGQ